MPAPASSFRVRSSSPPVAAGLPAAVPAAAVTAPARRPAAMPAACVDHVRIDGGRSEASEEPGLRGRCSRRKRDCTSCSERERKISHSFLRFIACFKKSIRKMNRSCMRRRTAKVNLRNARSRGTLNVRSSLNTNTVCATTDNDRSRSAKNTARDSRSKEARIRNAGCRRNSAADNAAADARKSAIRSRSCNVCATTSDSDGRCFALRSGLKPLRARRGWPASPPKAKKRRQAKSTRRQGKEPGCGAWRALTENGRSIQERSIFR